VFESLAPNPGAKLPRIRIGLGARKQVVVAYADDVTIFLTTQADFAVIREAIRCFEKATGASLNPRKSNALAVEGWSTTTNFLDVDYYREIKIMGMEFASTNEQSIQRSWAHITDKFRA
jgi:phosphoribosylformimino-5-aminoimidazole carboxamide ribonucleotide (ProFAR) isomerase